MYVVGLFVSFFCVGCLDFFRFTIRCNGEGGTGGVGCDIGLKVIYLWSIEVALDALEGERDRLACVLCV